MKRIAALFLLLVLSFSASAQERTRKPQASDSLFKRGDSIVVYAQQFLGTTYKYGSCSPASGFDCSGFTYYVYRHFGISIPRSSRDYVSLGKTVKKEEARRGDLILFTGTKSKTGVGHVGIVVSNPGEPLRFIHSSSSKNHWGVVVTEFEASAYPKRFVKICRVL